MFSLICAWINGWVNAREAGDSRCHCAHYDVTVMLRLITYTCCSWQSMRTKGPVLLRLSLIVNPLWPSDAIQRHGIGSTLAQVMACCLMATIHHRNQCWLCISGVFFIHMRAISQEQFWISILDMSLNMSNLISQSHYPVTNALNLCMHVKDSDWRPPLWNTQCCFDCTHPSKLCPTTIVLAHLNHEQSWGVFVRFSNIPLINSLRLSDACMRQ